jgi:hypothetical protein
MNEAGEDIRSFDPSITGTCIAEHDMDGLEKLPDSHCNSMKSYRRVGSHNPLNFPNCHTPPLGTTTRKS